MTMVLRPTPPGANKKECEWLLRGEWGERTYPPMDRPDFYHVIAKELIEAGILQSGNQHRSDVWKTIIFCSWTGQKWVIDKKSVDELRTLPKP